MHTVLIKNCSRIFQSAAEGVLKDRDILIEDHLITKNG